MTNEDLKAKTVPPTVIELPLSGKLTQEKLDELYGDVKAQIEDKTNLLNGRIEHEFDFKVIKFRLRNQNRRTQRAMASPALLPINSEPSFEQVLRHRTYSLISALVSLEGREIAVPDPDPSSVEDWLANEAVSAMFSSLEDIDSALVEMMINAQFELEQVRTFYLTENLKNL